MTLVSWRNATFVLVVVCGYQRWQSFRNGSARSTTPPGGSDQRLSDTPAPRSPTRLPSSAAPSAGATHATSTSFHGFTVPAWALRLAPQPGESMRAYRDRILPIAQLALAPHRARVARTRDDFAALDPRQRAELDAAVKDAATAIQARVMSALASGELQPASFKPMTGVTLARDVLDIVGRGNTRFVNSLAPEQRTELASHRFDFADYLLFSTHWEDALRVLD
jgi:hypothetical protein